MGVKPSTIVWTASFIGLAIATVAIERLTKVDPFSGLRENQQALDPYVLRLHEADMDAWNKGKLVASAHVGEVDLGRDLSTLVFNRLTRGRYSSSKLSFAFSADKGVLSQSKRTFEGLQSVHVQNHDFDLDSHGFIYGLDTKTLSIPNDVSGTLSGGQVHAVNIVYSLNTGDYSTGKISWYGIPPLKGQDAALLQAQAGDQSEPASKPWKFVADSSRNVTSNGVTIQIWTNAHATDGDIVVTSPLIERNLKTDVLVCKGPVKYFSAKANLICDKATIYRKEKRAVLEGSVVMFVKPEDQEKLDETEVVTPLKPIVPDDLSKDHPPAVSVEDPVEKQLNTDLRSSDSVRKYPLTIRADKIEYWYQKGMRHAIVTGSPEAQQELPGGRWRYLWAPRGYYDGEKETLRMAGDKDQYQVRMKNSLGDDLTSEWFESSTKKGDDDYSSGPVKATVFSDDQDLNSAVDKAGQKDKKGPGKKGP